MTKRNDNPNQTVKNNEIDHENERRDYIYKSLKTFLNKTKSNKMQSFIPSILKVAKKSSIQNFVESIKKIYVKSEITERVPLVFLVDYLYRNIKTSKLAHDLEPFMVHIMENTFLMETSARLKLAEILNDWETNNIYSAEMRFRIRKTFQKYKSVAQSTHFDKNFAIKKRKLAAKTTDKNKKKSFRNSYENALESLYSTIGQRQCAICGLRIKEEKSEIEKHNLLHNKNLNVNKEYYQEYEDAIRSRGYYLTDEEWLKYVLETIGLIKKEEENAEKKTGKNKKIELKVYSSSKYPQFCDICGDSFKKTFDQSSEDWVYADTLISKENEKMLVHYDCVKKDSEKIVISID